MKMKYRFFCTKCDKFLDRRMVSIDMWENRYYCKWCGLPVVRSERLMYGIIREFVDYLKTKGDTDDYE